MRMMLGPSPAPTNTCSVPAGQCPKSPARSGGSVLGREVSLQGRRSLDARDATRDGPAPMGFAEEIEALVDAWKPLPVESPTWQAKSVEERLSELTERAGALTVAVVRIARE